MSDLKKRVAEFTAYRNGYLFAPVSDLVRDLAAEVERLEGNRAGEIAQRVAELELQRDRVLICHEESGGRCFDCRRLLGLDSSRPASEEWQKYFDLVNDRDALKAENERLKGELEACLDFKPDAARINALPKPLRRYIHDLETNADPAGTIREAICQRENAEALAVKVIELKAERDALAERLRSCEELIQDCMNVFGPDLEHAPNLKLRLDAYFRKES